MVQVLLILIFAALHAFDMFAFEPVEVAPVKVFVATVGGLGVLWGVFHVLCGRWGRVLDATGRVSIVRRAERTMLTFRLLAGAGWGLCIFQLGWLTVVRNAIGDRVLLDEACAALPLLLFIIATWFSIYPLELRLREALLLRELQQDSGLPVHPPLTRSQYITSNIRHQMLLFLVPLSLMSAWEETVYMYLNPWLLRVASHNAEVWSAVLQYAGMLTVLIVSPTIMRHVWDTVAISDSPLRDQVRAMCRQYGVRVRGPLLWRTHGAMVNGAILGVFWPLRYMLLSDALLERLSADQVEAVMAHEVAHVRRRHLVWLGLCILASVLLLGWAGEGMLSRMHSGIVLRHSEVVSAIFSVAGLAGAGLVFAAVSRRFEWQADAFAAQHLSRGSVASTATLSRAITPAAVGIMSSALQAVADLNGIDPRRFTWRHGSIRERQRRLATLVDRPLDALPIDRQVVLIKVAALLGIAASIVPIVVHALGGAS